MIPIERNTAGKNDSIGINAALLCLAPQIVFGCVISIGKPKHTIVDIAQELHPYVKNLRRDLVAISKRAKYKPRFR